MNKSCHSICLFVVLAVSCTAFGQDNSQHFGDMVRQIEQRASNLQKPGLNFQTPKFSNPLEKFKALKMPKFSLMERLKGIASPAAGGQSSRPVLGGLAKLFSPSSTRKSPSFWDRVTGGGNPDLLPESQRRNALNELNSIARGFGQRAGQATQDVQNGFGQGVQNGINRLSNGVIPGPQPPLRSARESYGSGSRY